MTNRGLKTGGAPQEKSDVCYPESCWHPDGNSYDGLQGKNWAGVRVRRQEAGWSVLPSGVQAGPTLTLVSGSALTKLL